MGFGADDGHGAGHLHWPWQGGAGCIPHSECECGVTNGKTGDFVHMQTSMGDWSNSHQGLVTYLKILEIVGRFEWSGLRST